VSNKCYLSLAFVAGATDYKTVQVQVRAYRASGLNTQQKRAKGYIYGTGIRVIARPCPRAGEAGAGAELLLRNLRGDPRVE
jgi:hypothetical protein